MQEKNTFETLRTAHVGVHPLCWATWQGEGGASTQRVRDVTGEPSVRRPPVPLGPNNQLVGQEGGGCQLIVLMVATAGHSPRESSCRHPAVKLPSPCLEMPLMFSHKQTHRATASLQNSLEVELVRVVERRKRISQLPCLNKSDIYDR